MGFEQWIKNQFRKMDRHFMGIKLEIKTDRRGHYLEKQPFDFIILGRGQDTCFDAKECGSPKFYLSKVPNHQIEALGRCQRMGNRAGLLVWFYKEDAFKRNLRLITDFSKKSYTIYDGESFDFSDFSEVI